MFKKLSASMFALALVAGLLVPAQAQDTIAIYIDDPVNGLSRYGDTVQGQPFDIVVVTETSQSSCASEFIVTELLVVTPGVFKLSTNKINNTQLDLGDNSVGEYLIAYAGCVASGPQEIVRVQYGDFGGVVGADVVLSIRGFQPGDSQPSSFGGQMGYITPTDDGIVLAPAPWTDGDVIDPTKDPNVDSADGVCVLNAVALPNETESVSSLKARF
jgi:hypothetical protein